MDTLTGLIKLPPQDFARRIYRAGEAEAEPITASTMIGTGLGLTGPHHCVTVIPAP